MAHGLPAVEGCAVHVGKEREHVVLGFRRVEVNRFAFLESVEHMAGKAIVAPGQHSQIDGQRGIETKMRQTFPQPFPAADRRHDVEQRVIFRDRPVMHHAVVGGLEPKLADQLPLRGYLVKWAVIRAEPRRGVPERHHVAGPRVHLGVGGESPSGHLAVEPGVALRLHRHRVHDQCGRVLLECVQLAAVNPGVGIGSAANPVLDHFIVGQRITIGAE